ncbi:hypothetical protein ES708_28903 [subsurface metagenome]
MTFMKLKVCVVNLNDITFNKLCSGSIEKHFEMPNVSYTNSLAVSRIDFSAENEDVIAARKLSLIFFSK